MGNSFTGLVEPPRQARSARNGSRAERIRTKRAQTTRKSEKTRDLRLAGKSPGVSGIGYAVLRVAGFDLENQDVLVDLERQPTAWRTHENHGEQAGVGR